MKPHILIPRELLLVEIERRCPDTLCNARMHIGLTKEEARAYRGFECERCERSWEDELSERDIPEWWEDLGVTGLNPIREMPSPEPEGPSEVVNRTSDKSRRTLAKTEAGEVSF